MNLLILAETRMTRPMSDEEGDSAPEDITFKEAKNEALEQLKTVKEAVSEKKKERKEKIRKRQAILKEQKEKKLRRLAKLESKKLPEDFLQNLSDTKAGSNDVEGGDAVVEEELQPIINKITMFRDEEESDQEEVGPDSADFLALDTEQTKFKVLTSTDLGGAGFKSSEASTFRERMLFGPKSGLRREPHAASQRRQKMLKKAGGDVRVRASNS